ncbi:DUF6057 family protein [Draconibacterium sp.]|nr:DUF6057 family protein [Draconibacterium sp.]
MNSINKRTNRLFQLLPFALFFFMGTFYLYYFTSYIFFYQEKSGLFLVSFEYLFEHLNQPGGFLVYLGELQTTLYYYPLIGALIVVAEIVGVIFLIEKIAKVLVGGVFYFLPFFIGAVLFLLQTNYQYLAFNNLGIIIQLVLFYRVITYSQNKYRWIAVGLFPVIYFLFGSFSVIFLWLFSIFLIQKKDWLKLAGTWILACLFFFIGREYLFFQTTNTLWQYPFDIQDIGVQIKLFATVVGIVAILPLLTKIEMKRISAVLIKKVKLVELNPFLIIIVLAFLVIPRIDKKNSHYFYVEKLFYEQKYDELVEFNKQFPSSNMLTAFLNNVALVEIGRLTESFFSFPQSPDGGTLFLKWEIISEVLKRGGYFYYSVGMINEAQRWAYEYMVMQGNSPEALKMMIKTDLIKGKNKIAEKYISILEKSIFYREDAREFRALLYNDNAILNHSELSAKRLLDAKQDFFVQSDNPAINLNFIIKADSTNLAAIEYKLAWLMLQKDMRGVVDLLPVMEKAGYLRIPKNVEEVVVSYKLLKVGEMPEMKRLQINPRTEQRFQRFYRTFQQHRGNKHQAQQALAREFSDTYWYYVFFS